MKLRKGDTVRVITGKDRGKEGVIEHVYPQQNKVLVTGVSTATKHQRATRADEQGGRIDKDMPIDASNVMFLHKGDTVRLGFELKDGKKVRVARPSGEEV